MASLIGNGTKLYRRDASLVRTPIRVRIVPKDIFAMPIGEWDKDIGVTVGCRKDYYAVRGNASEVFDAYYETAYRMVMSARNWGAVWLRPSFDVGCCFYHGGHSPTTDTFIYADGKTSVECNFVSEAFLNFMAYRFEIPEEFDDLRVSDVDIRYTASTKRAFGSLNNVIGANNTSQTRMYGFVYDDISSVTPMAMMNRLESNGYHVGFNIPGMTGYLNAYNFWSFGGGNAHLDGRIPINSPMASLQADVTNSAVNEIDEKRSFYLCVFSSFGFNNNNKPTPNYLVDTPLWWSARIVRDIYGYVELE